MPDRCTVLIAPADRLPTLQERTAEGGELLAFTDADAIRAFETIARRQPQVVALDRLFASTPRGTALIGRIQADPTLSDADIRVVSADGGFTRVPRAAPIAAPAPGGSPDLDQRGTRRAPRVRIPGVVGVMVDGNAATLVDLSRVGAQVVSGTVLRPNQRVRMALTDDHGAIRFNAAVAWASFEIPANSGPRYRAGIEFVDADGEAVDAFCLRHRGAHHS